MVHGLQVVTRNVRHFRASGTDVISPWQADPV
jgi:predicted nucleic acid-binding protein